MKIFLYFLIIFCTAISTPIFAKLYDDWPDEAICLWLEQRPKHKGYLEENEKRNLNCFEREDFQPRDFVHEPLSLKMK